MRVELDSEKTEQQLRNQQAHEEEIEALKTRVRQQESLLQELVSQPLVVTV